MHWLDPDYLPETRGTLTRFLINPKGDIDGLLLDDGTEIHTAPHLSARLVKALAPGKQVRVRGVRPRNVDMIVALSIAPARGPAIEDQGPDAKGPGKPKPHGKHETAEHDGIVASLLHGPEGNVHGVLLEDGVIIRIPPHAAPALGRLLTPGNRISAEGDYLDTPWGEVIHAQAVGPTPKARKPVHKKHHEE